MSARPHPFHPLITETLAATGARSVLGIGPVEWPAGLAGEESLTIAEALACAAQRARQELAIASLAGSENARDARQLIAVMRDLLARQVLVFVPENLLDDTTLIGLGLTRQARFEIDAASWQAWSYDIRTYKSVPDWLNPRFWANPENWNKYRW